MNATCVSKLDFGSRETFHVKIHNDKMLRLRKNENSNSEKNSHEIIIFIVCYKWFPSISVWWAVNHNYRSLFKRSNKNNKPNKFQFHWTVSVDWCLFIMLPRIQSTYHNRVFILIYLPFSLNFPYLLTIICHHIFNAFVFLPFPSIQRPNIILLTHKCLPW